VVQPDSPEWALLFRPPDFGLDTLAIRIGRASFEYAHHSSDLFRRESRIATGDDKFEWIRRF
jgi:hypothetical protein